MRTAQTLYEGVELGETTVGLITYMRTDSVTIAKEAIDQIREFILGNYGNDFLPKKPNAYNTKSKNAQEAHEAIRPTLMKTPESVKSFLSPDQYKLYNLIWQRTIASQMSSAVIDSVAVDIEIGPCLFRANGSTIKHPGFLKVYEEGQDDKEEEKENHIPELVEGEIIKCIEVIKNQHFTEPPPRYSEASLVKALESFGIGRPSTYASIISTILARNYVELDKKRFHPTDIGKIVTGFLTKHFTNYVDYEFTAKLEEQLDAISRAETKHIPVLDAFWDPFKQRVDTIMDTVSRSEATHEQTGEQCPECGGNLIIKLGRGGRFIGCDNYPECKFTRSLTEKKEPESTGVTCPKCNDNDIVKRVSRRGKVFFGCKGFPKCKYALWNEPVTEPCPKCNWPITVIKETKRYGKQQLCPQEDCDWSKNINEE